MYGYVRMGTDMYGWVRICTEPINGTIFSVLIRINALPVYEIRANEVSHSLPTLWKYFHSVVSAPLT